MFWCKHFMLRTCLLKPPSVCPIGLGISSFHFHPILLKVFAFLLDYCLHPFFNSVVSCSVSVSLYTLYCFCWWYSTLFCGRQIEYGCYLNFLIFIETCFVSRRVATLGESSRSCWEETLFCVSVICSVDICWAHLVYVII